MWETQIQSLGRENPLEEEMVTHSRGAWRATVQGATKELDMTKHAHTHTHTGVQSGQSSQTQHTTGVLTWSS